jgi:GTP1/Obg family GTP-binding protein
MVCFDIHQTFSALPSLPSSNVCLDQTLNTHLGKEERKKKKEREKKNQKKEGEEEKVRKKKNKIK